MAQVQGKCIFCGGTGLTKEHVFPKWSRTLLEAAPSHTHSRIMVTSGPFPNSAFVTPDSRAKQGFLNQRLRVVCRSCNTGWMSNIETASKDILSRLINGETVRLGEVDQRQIALWVTLKSAVFDRDDPATAALIADEYSYIKSNMRPPENWRIFVAKNVAQDWQTRIFHLGAEFMSVNGMRQSRINTQKTMIGMKNVVLCAISSTAQNPAGVVERMRSSAMWQIWPFMEEFDWPLPEGLGSDYLNQFAYSALQYEALTDAPSGWI